MWERLFETAVNQSVRTGSLTIAMPGGQVRRYGDGTGPEIAIAIDDSDTLKRIVLNPELGVGEAYMDGRLTIEGDDLYGFLTLGIRNVAAGNTPGFQKPMKALRRIRNWVGQMNTATKARRNVAHHYDLSSGLYDLFLDADRQYSCAYFARPDMSLEEAQAAKKAHIAAKLLIEPDLSVLDIGCGWGGLGLTLARDYGARVVGVTLSREQLKIAQERAAVEGLDGRVDFRLMDYRHVPETFDRVVSVGMFEHVGQPHYREYFRQVNERLKPDGVALIHTIGRTDPPSATSPWIDKYIFPGGYVPSMSETMAAVEKEDLYPCDVEVWRLHYAETLKAWHDRFMARRDEAVALYDERFCRMWRYYLIASELTFRLNRQCVFQFQLAHHQEAVPLTRDYLYPADREARQMAAE
ncbi:MAG: cyclopropane-fatty-acyl-phospholipid synthase family protein [Paracoccaceae bacterium]|nr:cyclopropane-fatty-acyl-phospholipid synthase family protein [Paracoccaceae bacterium]